MSSSDRVFVSVFLIIFAVFGSLIMIPLGRTVMAGLATHTWRQTECEITSSHVVELQKKDKTMDGFRAQVDYRYTFDGQPFSNSTYELGAKSFSDYGDAARLVAKFPAGQNTVCYVNPAQPPEAVLHPNSLFEPLILLFPLIFVLIGLVGLALIWRPNFGATPQPVARNSSNSQPVATFIFGAFFLIGSISLWMLFVHPVIYIQQARGWTEVPCVVIASQVDSHRGSKTTTYSVNIFYRYEINGREYKANRYGFMGGSSSGSNGKWAIVRQFPPATKAVCYVNPSDAYDAVLERGFTSDLWFGLIPVVFLIIGAVGLFFDLRRRLKPI